MTNDVYVIPAAEISASKPVEKSHFLNENAKRAQISLGSLAGLSEFDFSIVEVEPGFESTEHHMHHHEDECIYVLQGTATARIGATSYEIHPGDFVGFRKGGLAHSLKNNGQDVFRCIVVSQRKDHDVSDYPRLGKRLFRNRGLTWNMVDLDVIDRPFGAKT